MPLAQDHLDIRCGSGALDRLHVLGHCNVQALDYHFACSAEDQDAIAGGERLRSARSGLPQSVLNPRCSFASAMDTSCAFAYRRTFWHSLFLFPLPAWTICLLPPNFGRTIGLPQTRHVSGSRKGLLRVGS